MSIRLPESVEYTEITWPGSLSRIALMSSISGPGQKLPRASTTRVAWDVNVADMAVHPS
jgi:hypothetical protein